MFLGTIPIPLLKHFCFC